LIGFELAVRATTKLRGDRGHPGWIADRWRLEKGEKRCARAQIKEPCLKMMKIALENVPQSGTSMKDKED
jgi:hypothetical protein